MGNCCGKRKTPRTSEKKRLEKSVPEIQSQELKEIFEEFDINKDGFIQQGELRSVMLKMGQAPTDQELDAMFKAADTDGDGKIDFDEFVMISQANPLSTSLKTVFQELDVNGDGTIARSELRTAFDKMGHSLSDEEIATIYKQVDVNQDGKISFEEFCKMMTKKKS